MVRLDMTREQAETLAALLQREAKDLSYEIANTDSLDYRQGLKRKKVSLQQLLESLTATRQMV